MSRSTRPARFLAIVAGALALAAVSACGGGVKSNGVAAKSPTEILAAAKAALTSATSVHITGSTLEGSDTVTLDIRISQNHTGVGAITINGDRIDLVRIADTIYFKAPASFYTKTGAPAAAGQLLTGKYLKAPASTAEFADFANFADINSLADQFLVPSGTVTKVDGKKVHGKATVGLQDTVDGKNDGTLYIATTGPAYPLSITPPPGKPGSLDFIDYGAAVTAAAPPADQVVDYQQLAQLGGGQ